MNGDVSYNFI